MQLNGGIQKNLWTMGSESIRSLEVENGILASARSEVYGCIFGRDSLITGLSLLRVYRRTNDAYYLSLVRKILTNLALLQGRVVTIDSGEEPGKMIHEFRPENHEHLTAHAQNPWFVYGDNIMRNYDSVDATLLYLMAVHEYARVARDEGFIDLLLPSVHAALDWVRTYSDSNNDGFIDYRLHPDRRCGGLQTQSWMDSHESVFFEESDERPRYPIAPVEVQAYAYVALCAWSDFFLTRDCALAEELSHRAHRLKKAFNASFVIESARGALSLAFALDGDGRPLVSARSSMGHCLFAAWRSEAGAMPECILDQAYVPRIARRILAPDLYAPRAGIRTLSMRSRRYDPNSYHNGSIWPHDTALIADGLETFGFREEARRVRRSLMRAYRHFKTPLELFVYSRGKFAEYCGPNGQGACRTQAWSAASLLSSLSSAE